MVTTRYVRSRRNPTPESGAIWLQMAVALFGGVALFLGVLTALSLGYRVLYSGRIFPGVSIAGVDVSGLKPDEAAIRLSTALTYPYSGKLVFKDGDRIWLANPAQLGMVFDPGVTAEVAFKFGRSGNVFQNINDQMNSAQVGIDLPPVIIYDQRVAYNYLQGLATELDQPVKEAELVINGLDVSTRPGQLGRALNVDASLVFLNAQMQTFRDGEVKLFIQEKAPEVMDASAQADAARRLLSAPLALTLPDSADRGPWYIQPNELSAMLRVSRVETGAAVQYRLELDPAMLEAKLKAIAAEIDRPAQNPRFTFNDETSQLELIQSAVIGRTVNIPDAVRGVQDAIAAGQTIIPLRLDITQPLVSDTSTGQDLGIVQLVSSQTTYFYGSTVARLQNIETAAAQFHGVLVAPGETFSMGATLGDVSLDSGYAEALIIYGGRTIKGVGGGVCQVSTTLFRTAFFGGFPVNERYAHAYRVYYYEQKKGGGYDPNLAGFDATVYFPVVDFKFTNDTPNWLLMETYFSPSNYSLTWKFYSTSDGRSVTYANSGPQNVVPAPEPALEFNAELDPGAMKQVDWAAEGADVTIERTVMRDNKILFVDKFITHYEPWRAVCEYGPGIDDPEKIAKRRDLCQGN